MKRPNIIYMHSHDTGRYVQPYGYAVPTPNLQQFAEQSVLFRNAHCVNPTCSPSRACLLTSQYPHQIGMLGLAHRGFGLNDPKKHIVHTLADAGYECVLAGTQHVLGDFDYHRAAKTIGYQRSLERTTKDGGAVVNAVIPFLREAHDQPFYLAIGFSETHRHFPSASLEHDPRYMRAPAILPDTKQTRQDWADYCTSASMLDAAYGRILGELTARGLDQNTIVLITTDHGIAFPYMKCNLTDHGTGVLMMLRGPGVTDQPAATGKVVDGMVSHLDVFPTLCELADVPKPAWLEGKSLLPLVWGEKDEVHEQLVTMVNAHAASEPMRCVRTKRYSYIRRYDDLPHRVMPNVDESLSKTALAELGWRESPEPAESLFDLVFDPMERCNLAADPRHAQALADMRHRLETWQQRYDDPVATGPLNYGPDAKLDAQSQMSPT